MGLVDYARLMQNMSDTFGPGSFNLTGLLTQSGVASVRIAQIADFAAGVGVLALALYRRSFGLVVVASLVLSPIVWLHYFVLLVVPIALRWPRLAAAWLIPLLLWIFPGTEAHHHTFLTLMIVVATVTIAEWWRTPPAALDPVTDPGR
jgi:hypothetical protein